MYASRNQECSLRSALFLYPPVLRRGRMVALGFPWDLRLWGAFFSTIWDISAAPMWKVPRGKSTSNWGPSHGLALRHPWADFTLRHSRYWAKKHGVTCLKLCYADKMAFVLTPAWLYLPMARATGELAEYMAKSRDRQAGCGAFNETERAQLESGDPAIWLKGLQSYTRRWVEQHRNGGADTWTVRPARSVEGSCIAGE